MSNQYAQLDSNQVCHTISDYNTGIPAGLENLGQKRIWVEATEDQDGYWKWEEVRRPAKPHEPSNTEIAQSVSELQASLEIAGVI